MFERAAVAEIGGDFGRAERVIADRRKDAGRNRGGVSSARHQPGSSAARSAQPRRAPGRCGTASPCDPRRCRRRRYRRAAPRRAHGDTASHAACRLQNGLCAVYARFLAAANRRSKRGRRASAARLQDPRPAYGSAVFGFYTGLASITLTEPRVGMTAVISNPAAVSRS